MTIIVRWHYGGAFVKNPYLSYLGGIEESLRIDLGYLSIFNILGYARDYERGNVVGVYYRHAANTKDDFLLLWNDKILLEVVKKIGKNGTLELYVGHRVDESNVSSSEDDSYIASSDKEDSTDENLDDNSDEEYFLSTLEGSDVDEELRNARKTVRELKKNKSGKEQAKPADEGINLREAELDVGFENVEGNNQRYDGKITEDEDY
ncbi:hypothetical protein GH714_003627 [Hevea brasiliensis]|uniref:PB1-like domain-containing protein n=1 Tax=Hevea brasiliensis TaxID=3981 RepID=A0A6A6L8M5_HEVBR|nr:hypothetical protein GH714_003627 [Hevea brasiliensis]